MNSMIPVLILAFNRPDFLQKRLLELEKQSIKPKKIIVSVDGPRYSNSRDYNDISQILSILKSDINSHILVIMREKNLGCTNNIILSVSEVLAEYEEIIVIEDDVSISPHFYAQMIGAINFFLKAKENCSENIRTIGGFSSFYNNSSNLVTRFLLPANKWRKTKYFHSWGWATSRIFWSRFIRLDDELIDLDSLLSTSKHWNKLSARKKLIWKKRFPRSWDYQVQGNLFLQEGYNIFPNYRITNNEGLGDSRATHTRHKKPWYILGNTFSLNGPKNFKIKKMGIIGRFIESNGLAADGYFIARGRNKGIRTLVRGLFTIEKL
jgi:hypothetical protein